MTAKPHSSSFSSSSSSPLFFIYNSSVSSFACPPPLPSPSSCPQSVVFLLFLLFNFITLNYFLLWMMESAISSIITVYHPLLKHHKPTVFGVYVVINYSKELLTQNCPCMTANWVSTAAIPCRKKTLTLVYESWYVENVKRLQISFFTEFPLTPLNPLFHLRQSKAFLLSWKRWRWMRFWKVWAAKPVLRHKHNNLTPTLTCIRANGAGKWLLDRQAAPMSAHTASDTMTRKAMEGP